MHIRDLTQYLAELAQNNNRAWFVMNKPRYDILRAEFLELVTSLITQLSKFDPAIAHCRPKKALFRIHRDLRFSHDKRPYKTYFSAALTASGLKKPSQGGGPAYYFQFSDDNTMLVAAGEYMPPPARLLAIRTQVMTDPESFSKILKKLKKIYGDLQTEGQLTRPPKGFGIDTPHLAYIKRRSFIVWKTLPLDQTLSAHPLQTELIHLFKNAYPLIHWLRNIPLT